MIHGIAIIENSKTNLKVEGPITNIEKRGQENWSMHGVDRFLNFKLIKKNHS